MEVAVLHQSQTSGRQPLSFFSKDFMATEKRYSTFGRELLTSKTSISETFLSPGGRYEHVYLNWPTSTFIWVDSSVICRYPQDLLRQGIRSTLKQSIAPRHCFLDLDLGPFLISYCDRWGWSAFSATFWPVCESGYRQTINRCSSYRHHN